MLRTVYDRHDPSCLQYSCLREKTRWKRTKQYTYSTSCYDHKQKHNTSKPTHKKEHKRQIPTPSPSADYILLYSINAHNPYGPKSLLSNRPADPGSIPGGARTTHSLMRNTYIHKTRANDIPLKLQNRVSTTLQYYGRFHSHTRYV